MLLGLDIGTKRTGVALSSGALAAEYTTLAASGEALIGRIAELCAAEAIEMVVVGLPRNNDGSDSAQTAFVTEITEQLRRAISVPVVAEDELLTTHEAYRQMAELGIAKDEAEQRVDQYSAKLILQQYIDSHRDGDYAVL